ncbi:MFS transporter [Lysinibacillus sp. NPDC056232]|uniref:MFS transporter n=1 Tax=Lysinibacillus sp. NPDC056232 TaxID=3345756 RepID=UPI0035E07520
MKNKSVILALLFLGWALGNFDRFVINYAIVDISKDLSLNATHTGIVLSTFFLGYAIMQIPGGLLADKFGPRKIVTISVLLLSLFTGLTGGVNSLFMLLVIRFLFGLGEGGFMPASTKAISETFPHKERGRAQSILLSSGGVMAILTPILSAYLLISFGWRPLFIGVALIGALVVVLYLYFLKVPHEAISQDSASVQVQQGKSPLKTVLKMPLLWSIFVSFFAIYTVQWGLTSWIPSYLSSVRGLDLVSIGWVQTIPGVAMLIGMLLGGVIMDKIPQGKEKIPGIIGTVLIAVLMYFMFTATSITSFIIFQTIVTFAIAVVIILLNAILLKNTPTSVAGSAMGFVNVGGQLAGFLAPTLIGFIFDASGSFDMAFWMLIGFAIVCLIAIITFRTTKQPEQPEQLSSSVS